ncbi:hypothetical protein TWF730_007008 [Orbilia blumenaviensis]|uniref:Uncharacterized protein n=1 Tax=Orbilia blumenaviensis TaxID=1796055 RepID=A0AAV9VGG4_9PEZI
MAKSCKSCSILLKSVENTFGEYSIDAPLNWISRNFYLSFPYHDKIKINAFDASEPITIIIGAGQGLGRHKKYVLPKDSCVRHSNYFATALRTPVWPESQRSTFNFRELQQFGLIATAIKSGTIFVEPSTCFEFYNTADYLCMDKVMEIICQKIGDSKFINFIPNLDLYIQQLLDWFEKWQDRQQVQYAFIRAIFAVEVEAGIKRSKVASWCKLRKDWEEVPRRWGLVPLGSGSNRAGQVPTVPPGAMPERYQRLQCLRQSARRSIQGNLPWILFNLHCKDCRCNRRISLEAGSS